MIGNVIDGRLAIIERHMGLVKVRVSIARSRDMITLKAHYGAAIETAIGRARATGKRETVNAPDGAEVYAYPHARGIEWGVNAACGGFNLLQGIRRPDGTDEAVS